MVTFGTCKLASSKLDERVTIALTACKFICLDVKLNAKLQGRGLKDFFALFNSNNAVKNWVRFMAVLVSSSVWLLLVKFNSSIFRGDEDGEDKVVKR